MVWGMGSENIKKKQRHPLLTAFFIVSQGFFPLCLFPCLQEILRKTQQGGVRGAEEVQGLGERAGDQSQLHFINICFHSAVFVAHLLHGQARTTVWSHRSCVWKGPCVSSVVVS